MALSPRQSLAARLTAVFLAGWIGAGLISGCVSAGCMLALLVGPFALLITFPGGLACWLLLAILLSLFAVITTAFKKSHRKSLGIVAIGLIASYWFLIGFVCYIGSLH